MNWDDVIEEIRSWVVEVLTPLGVTDGQVRLAPQAAPAPPFPYADLMLVSTPARAGQDARVEPQDNTGLATVTGNRAFWVSLDFYSPQDAGFPGTRAMDLAQRVADALDERFTLDKLSAAGIVTYQVGGVTNLTGLMGSEFVDRFHLEMKLGTASVRTDNVGIIESTEITEAYKDQTGAVRRTKTYTIGG